VREGRKWKENKDTWVVYTYIHISEPRWEKGKGQKKKHETSKQSKRDRNALKEQRAHSEMIIRLQPHSAPPHRPANRTNSIIKRRG